MKIKCIIVDDEKGSHGILSNYIEQIEALVLERAFYNAVEAYNYLSANKVDLIFLDIKMPEIDGFGLLDMLRSRPPYVVFCTAFSEYAVKGFEYDAVDYLQKPIRFERFVKAVEKAKSWCNSRMMKDDLGFIEIKVNGRLHRVEAISIHYVESLGNYVKIHTSERTYVVLMAIGKIEHELPDALFARIHKSYLVNLSSIEKVFGSKVTVKDTQLPIGNTYKRYFLDLYHKAIKP